MSQETAPAAKPAPIRGRIAPPRPATKHKKHQKRKRLLPFWYFRPSQPFPLAGPCPGQRRPRRKTTPGRPGPTPRQEPADDGTTQQPAQGHRSEAEQQPGAPAAPEEAAAGAPDPPEKPLASGHRGPQAVTLPANQPAPARQRPPTTPRTAAAATKPNRRTHRKDPGDPTAAGITRPRKSTCTAASPRQPAHPADRGKQAPETTAQQLRNPAPPHTGQNRPTRASHEPQTRMTHASHAPKVRLITDTQKCLPFLALLSFKRFFHFWYFQHSDHLPRPAASAGRRARKPGEHRGGTSCGPQRRRGTGRRTVGGSAASRGIQPRQCWEAGASVGWWSATKVRLPPLKYGPLRGWGLERKQCRKRLAFLHTKSFVSRGEQLFPPCQWRGGGEYHPPGGEGG